MPIGDFYAFQIFDSMEPFGERRQDIHAGIIASTVHNVNCTKESQMMKPRDFMPSWIEPPQKPQSIEDMKNRMLILQQFQNALVGNA